MLRSRTFLGSGFSALCLAILGCGTAATEDDTHVAANKYAEGSTGQAYLDIPGLGPQKVEYVVRNGHAMVDDLGIPISDLMEADARAAASAHADANGIGTVEQPLAGRRNEPYRWPTGVIPYEIDSAIPNPSQARTDILAGVALWNNAGTPVSLVSHTPGSGGDFVKFRIDTTLDPTGGGWTDFIGRKGGGQQQNIYISTVTPPGQGVVAHELGHTIGLYHEQQRADRRDFILVYDGFDGLEDRFTPCGQNKNGFLKYTAVPADQQPQWGPDGVDLGPTFDFSSRMLYAPGGCCGGQNCMTKLDGTTWTPNGTTLSAGDKDAVRRMYLDFGTSLQSLGSGYGSMAISSWGGDRYDVVAKRNSDGNMLHGFYNGTSWSGFTDNWGGVCKNLSSVSWGTERMDIVTVGTDNDVWHFWYQNGPVGWESLGGGSAGVVAITSQGFGKIDVFMVKTTDRNIYRRRFDEAGWGNWHPVTSGGGFSITGGSLDAASWGNQRIDLVAVKTNGAVQQVWTPDNGTNWFSNELIGSSPVKSFATAASWGFNRLDVIFNHTGTKLRRMSFEGGWGPHQNAYSNTFQVSQPDFVARAVNHGGLTDVDGVMNMVVALNGSWFVGTAVR